MHGWRMVCALLVIAVLAACGQAEPQTGAQPSTNGAAETAASGAASAAPAASASGVQTPDNPDAYGLPEEDTQPSGGTSGGTATGEFDCGDQSQLSESLAIFSWAEYWPEDPDNDLLGDFEAACGVRVTVDTYLSNEDLRARISAGNSGYDIIVPSDYMVQILAAEGLLAEIDKALLPNMANLDPDQMGLPYDPDNTYSIPYQYGTTGIAYNAAEVDPAPTSWAALFDPAQLEPYRNRASMFDDEREGTGAALKYLGHSVNSTDPAQLEAARQLLIAQKPLLARYDSESYTQGLASTELVIAQAWNGNTSLAKEENPDIEFVIPAEGGVIWQDALAIPADAPNAYTAHVFINNVLDGVIGARITNYTYYLTPNLAAEPLIDEEVRAIQFYPTDEERERLEYIERSGDPAIYSDLWTEVKGQ
jgi:spermidine/putrescine transport system substrate-binding protein